MEGSLPLQGPALRLCPPRRHQQLLWQLRQVAGTSGPAPCAGTDACAATGPSGQHRACMCRATAVKVPAFAPVQDSLVQSRAVCAASLGLLLCITPSACLLSLMQHSVCTSCMAVTALWAASSTACPQWGTPLEQGFEFAAPQDLQVRAQRLHLLCGGWVQPQRLCCICRI